MTRRQLYTLLGVVAAIALAVVVTVVVVSSSNNKNRQPPILLVHGYALTTECAGGDVRAYWSGLTTELLSAGWTNPVVPLSFYECDKNGVSMNEANRSGQYFPSGLAVGGGPSAGYTKNTDIRHLAYVLAWYVYDHYSHQGRTVDLVGHSMGGLMIRWALARVAAHDPAFPPTLRVAQVVTVSTPYGGAIPAVATLAACKDSLQCRQFAQGSSLLSELANAATPAGTDWSALGGGPCDLMTAASATDVHPAHHLSWAQPCYDHGKILFDDASAYDATATFQNLGANLPTTTTAAPHSLTAILRALQSNDW